MMDKEQKNSNPTLDALEDKIYQSLPLIYPKAVIRIRRAAAHGLQLSGIRLNG